MTRKKYKLRYLPLFEVDLTEIIDYIAFSLNNPIAADNLLDEIEEAILNRLNCPEAFEHYHSQHEREYPYYRIYVGNFVIFYVVIDNVMEVRRILYEKQEMNL